jgi:hypothetical protein
MLAVLTLASGCAGLNPSAPRLTYSARVYLLDAEEDLMTARTRAEQAQRDLSVAKNALTESEERLASLGKTAEALTAEAKASWRLNQARVAHAQRSLDFLEAAANCAEQRYGAQKESALIRFKLEGADETEQLRLLELADTCEAKLGAKRQALLDAGEALDKARSETDRATARAAAQAPAQYPRPFLE